MPADAVNGLWHINFVDTTFGNSGSGLIVFSNNTILGGDDCYFYSGAYSLNNNLITAELIIQHYQGPIDNIFGTSSIFSLNITGVTSDEFIMGRGNVINEPSRNLTFKMKLLKKA